MITVNGVSHSYADQSPRVLDDVSVTVPKGSLTALVGANGAGKSTLLGAIGRLLHSGEGRIEVDGLDVSSVRSKDLAKVLGVLRQENRLSARLTIADLARFGRFPWSQGRLTAEDHRIVEESLDWVELQPLRDRYLDEVSGGQRQRAFIAMALAQQTPYLLLDEPLNNLDLRHAHAVMQLVRRACDDLGRTVVVVLHDINVAASFADRIVAMVDGRVVREGTPAEVMVPDVLATVFGVEIPVVEVDGRPVALTWACGAAVGQTA